MKDRLGLVRSYVYSVFDRISDLEERRCAYIHSFGVAQCCALLAGKRGLNTELATVIGLLHDIYSYKTGHRTLHSVNGAELLRVAFKHELEGVFTDGEQTTVKSAVFHHSDKGHIHDEYDEIIKDSDVLQHYLFDITSDEFAGSRLTMIGRELGLSTPDGQAQAALYTQSDSFDRSALADIAESLAAMKIIGEESNANYMKIICYFPEETAFDELKNAWCAAFVYHCCLEAGLKLPLRTPHTVKNLANCRFACVIAWYEWGVNNGYCYFDKDGFNPERGDIVIYKNIIPDDCKQENSGWYDHIGIALSCDSKSLTVAEGNIGNQNKSGIITRKCDDTIGCYIRIPGDYKYSDWMIDYKTGEKKVVQYGGNCDDRHSPPKNR